MKQDTITKSELIEKYNQGNNEQRAVLRELFGQDYFGQDITDRVKSFDDACTVLNRVVLMPDVSMLREQDARSMLAYYKLIIIAEALNEGWKPNWADTDEYKWFPWLYVDTDLGSLAGLAYANTSYTASDALANIGSRLGFKTRELAEYAADQFKDLYRDFLLY